MGFLSKIYKPPSIGSPLLDSGVRFSGPFLLLAFGLLLCACATTGSLEMDRNRLSRHVRTHPADVQAWIQLGEIACRLEDYNGAVAALRRALRIDNQNPQAHYRLGLCYHQMGKFGLAVQQYRKLTLIDAGLADKLFKRLNPS